MEMDRKTIVEDISAEVQDNSKVSRKSPGKKSRRTVANSKNVQPEAGQPFANDVATKLSSGEGLTRGRYRQKIARICNEAKKAIHYRSAQYQTLLNQAPIGIYLVDADFRIREVNARALPIFGEIPDLVGRDFDEVSHLLLEKEYADEVVQIFRHTLETGDPYEAAEQSQYRVDRNVVEYYEWRVDRIILPDGRHGVVCYVRDISTRVKARTKLSESEDRYRGIVNQSVGGIVEIDLGWRFTTVNDRYCEITGYTREELLNMRMQDITYPDDLPRSLELYEKLAAGGAPFEIEKRYVRKDGSIIWLHKSVSAIRDVEGRVRSLVAVLIDITKSKQAEQALQQLNLELENLVQNRTAKLRAANQSLRDEIAERIRIEKELSLSRDRLRELSRRLVQVQEEERRAIARELHDRAGQTLSALNINLTIMNEQLSEDSRLRIGSRMNDTMKLTADVISVIRGVLSDLRPIVLDDYGLQAALKAYIEEYKSRYGIQVKLDQPPILMPRLEPGVAMTVLRIVQEALTNIVRHAQAKKVHVSIRFVDDMIHLLVQDDGIGIADGHRTGHSNSHGLKIMRERAEAFGGTLNVGQAPGRGTQVKANIPIQGPQP